MKADDTSGAQLPASHYSNGASHDTSGASKRDSPDSSRPKRLSQETLRRVEADVDGSLFFSKPPKPVIDPLLDYHGLSERTEIADSIQHTDSDSSPQAADGQPSGSHSRESTLEPADFKQRSGDTAAPPEDDEDVWEDEEDSILMDEHGNIVYEGPAYEDSASDVSDDADAEEHRQHRRAYREATQQYRKSRRALLLSGLSSSFASSPSSEELGTVSPTERDPASASPPSSLFDTERHTPPTDSYYQPHLAEPVDSVNARGRANGLRYDDDLIGDTNASVKQRYTREPDSTTIKQESPDFSVQSPTSAVGDDAFATPKGSGIDPKTPNGRAPDSRANGTASDRVTRPLASPRAKSSPLYGVTLSTSSSSQKPEHVHQDGLRHRRSHQDLAASPSISDPDMYDEPLETYMTPRLSLATLHEEATANQPSRQEQPISAHDTQASKEMRLSADVSAVPTRQDTSPFSLWDYLKEEVLATDFDATQEMKWERVTNFISIPFWMEKIIMFGFVVCLDSFLYTFTILPLRFGVAMWTWLSNSARWILGGQKRYLHSSHKCDILKMLLIVLSCVILSRITDASKMYHSVRGQDVVKLSVIFNVLEIADRLCCSFGQDLLDSLFSRSTLARRKNGKQPYLRPIGFFCLSLCYVLAHTLVLFYQLVTLNVAINSYDNALLTLLLSNQFVEIKSSVFKKFEKENVFQMTCADIVERFQLTFMLSAIGLRNLIELSGGSLEPSASPLPASFTVFPSLSLLETVLTPVCIVLASECIVDWLKHAFITKFNHIRPAVYGRFMDVLCRDLVVGGPSTKESSRKHTFVDQSPIISRRLGFAALPLACLLVRLILQIIGMIGDTSHIDECIAPVSPRISETGWIGVVARKLGANDIDNDWVRALDLFVRGSAWALTLVIAWAFLVAIKLLLGTNLVSFASHRYATMHERENEENLNAKDRAPIGTNKDERSYDKSLGRFIDKPVDDAIQIKLDGTHVAPAAAKDRDKSKDVAQPKAKKESSLMEVSRYNMVRSRIW